MENQVSPAIVAHCDWSKDAEKRWMSVAVRLEGDWHLTNPEPVGNPSSLLERLQGRAVSQGPVLLGFDFPIGLPATYGRLTGLGDFCAALTALGSGNWEEWFTVCEHAEQISVFRPFYPMRPGGTSRSHLCNGLSLTPDQLLRRCDRGTRERQPACSLFWTLGGNQVGKGAIAGWKEILQPNLHRIKIWPFEGSLKELTGSAEFVVAETYPDEVYHQLGFPRRGWSKRTQAGRSHVAPMLLERLSRKGYSIFPYLPKVISDGFGTPVSGEDQFDAVVGLLGMLDVVQGTRAEGFPNDERSMQWEGWILGQVPGP